MNDKENFKPIFSRGNKNAISRTEVIRDYIHKSFVDACETENIEALVLKSEPLNPVTWVKFECWLPLENYNYLSERCSAVLTLRPMEFHRFETEIDVEIMDGRRKYIQKFLGWNEDATKTLVQYLLRRKGYKVRKIRLPIQQKRRFFWQVWRPKNKITQCEVDRLKTISLIFALGPISFLNSGFALLIPIGIVGLIFGWRRRKFVINAEKPNQEPRNLLRVDSWQTLVFDMAPRLDVLRSKLKSEIAKASLEGLQLRDERIWYWGLDGVEERTQTVIILRRAIGFLHLYAYSGDLYVGWDAHVNGGAWVEQDLDSGIHKTTGDKVVFKSFCPGWQPPTEYDLTDANCLIEWLHGAVTKVIKRELKEQKIDQEIDFSILRGERKGIVGQKEHSEKKSVFDGFGFKRQN